jgi:hypothetical protein
VRVFVAAGVGVNVAVFAGSGVNVAVFFGGVDVGVAVTGAGAATVGDGVGALVGVPVGVRVAVARAGSTRTVSRAGGFWFALLRPSVFVMMTLRGPGAALGSAEKVAVSDSPFCTRRTWAVTPPPTVSVAPGWKCAPVTVARTSVSPAKILSGVMERITGYGAAVTVKAFCCRNVLEAAAIAANVGAGW